MRYMRLTCVVILTVLVIAPTAWSQRVATQKELDEAVLKIKATMDSKQSGVKTFKSQLMQARTLLANNPDQSLPMVAALLDDNDEQIRLNAAIVLAQTAQRAGTANQALLDALDRCLRDTSSAVAYWALQGFVWDSVPVEKRMEAIKASLDIKRPRLVRLAAARLAGDKNIRPSIPALVAHLQRILPSYTSEVETMLTYEVQVDERGNLLNPDMETPGYVGKGGATDGTTRRGYIVSPLSGGGAGGGRDDYAGYEDRGRYAPRGSTPTPSRRGATTSRRTPASPRGGRGDDTYGMEEDALVEKRQLNPERLSFQEVEMLILDLQELPSVYELHEIGYIVEGLAKANPRDMPFGEEASFERTPPWALDRCVEAAVAWLDKNGAEFRNAPAPETDAAAEETKETAAPAEKEAPEA